MSILLRILSGAVCGVLSGYGVGGGSLLMMLMTAVLDLEQVHAQSINLFYFLPTAAAALLFHAKNKLIEWRAIFPAVIAGCVGAAVGAYLASNTDPALLRKLFGVFLLIVGISEVKKAKYE